MIGWTCSYQLKAGKRKEKNEIKAKDVDTDVDLGTNFKKEGKP